MLIKSTVVGFLGLFLIMSPNIALEGIGCLGEKGPPLSLVGWGSPALGWSGQDRAGHYVPRGWDPGYNWVGRAGWAEQDWIEQSLAG